MRNLLFMLLLIAAVFVAVSAPPVQAGEEKVDICHVPPGNPENAQVISVGASAIPAHCAHGDPGVLVDGTGIHEGHDGCGRDLNDFNPCESQ